jgi:glycosyltransferase involved in cell wall biosynthesis
MTCPPANIGAVPRFSVITVCFNALTVLPNTLASLRGQTCRDYEWVVIDGASTDGSAEWLSNQMPGVFVTEPDNGIYDAMNKAVAHANGEWLFFLNAGDQLADPHVLSDILSIIDDSAKAGDAPSIVYGDVVYFGTKGERRRRFHWLTRTRLLFGDLCHQATFARRTLFEQIGPFDTTLRYNADFDWLVRAFKTNEEIRYVARNIAFFNKDGLHVVNNVACEAERDLVRGRYCSRPSWLLGHWCLRLELKLRRLFGEIT